MRNELEDQIIKDANSGDTTVLASLLELLTDEQVYNALGDDLQKDIDEDDYTCIYCSDKCFEADGCDEYNAGGF